MRWPVLCCCVFAVLIAGTKPVCAERGREKQLTPEALVEQLGDESYSLRERARRELEHREFDAQAALEAGLESDDLEVRYHCERILSEIYERTMQRKLDEFVKASGDGGKYEEFPAWQVAAEVLGDSEATRKLYVDMYRAESDTLKLLEKQDDGLPAHIDARSRFLQRRAQGLYQAPLGTGNIAALLLAAGNDDVQLSPAGHSMLYQLCYQQVFRDAMQSDKSPPLRKLLGRYVLTTEDQSAYQGMMLTMQYNMSEEGLACADKILNGKGTAPHMRQYAVLTVAKLGDEEHIGKLKSLLDEKQVCSQMQVNKVTYKTELRDIALFGIVHLAKQDPKKFGFDRFSPNPQMLANVHTLGFENDEKRQAAFDNWKKFETEQKAKVAEKE